MDRNDMLRAQADLRAKARAVAENPNATADEIKAAEKMIADALAFDSRIAMLDATASVAPVDEKAPLQPKKVETFSSLGEQLFAIAQRGTSGGAYDRRLDAINAAATGGSATIPSDGGFLIQSDYTTAMLKRAYDTGVVASRCDRIGISANADSLEVPYVDETSRATGSRWGGVRIYRAGETDPATKSKPQIGKWECRLEDLKGLAYMTDRLLADAGAMEQVYMQAFAEEFAFVLDDEIIRGDGAAKCLGLLNAPATVTIAKELNQINDTVVAENIVNMWSAMWGRSRANAVWFYNTEIEPQLYLLNKAIGTAGALVFMPPGGLSGAPYASLFGRPLVPIEQASAIGDVGDIILADMSQYQLIDKGGIRAESSIHVKFIEDEKCFKWVARVNGAPKWKSSLTPYKGAAARRVSPFVTLAAR
jgi:HK97 family phage major capsid protein